MGNCVQANNIIVPQAAQKRQSNISRLSKKSNDAIPTYPSIEDVLRNNRIKRTRESKENYVF